MSVIITYYFTRIFSEKKNRYIFFTLDTETNDFQTKRFQFFK